MIDWQAVIIAGIAAVPATVAAIAAWRQTRTTHKAVNSRMSEMLELTRMAAGDRATLVEKTAERNRKGAAALAAQQVSGYPAAAMQTSQGVGPTSGRP
jgi:hypothetical protein